MYRDGKTTEGFVEWLHITAQDESDVDMKQARDVLSLGRLYTTDAISINAAVDRYVDWLVSRDPGT